MKKNKIVILSLCALLTISACAKKATAYEATVQGHNGDLTLQVSFSDKKITEVKVLKHEETSGISDQALKTIPQAIVDNQSISIDTISGSTVTSLAILEATKKAITDAGLNVADYTTDAIVNDEETPETIFSQGWDATPTLGITKGDYYKEVNNFGRGEGHTGILEVVMADGKFVLVEFNEIGRPDYHTNAYQNEYKRLSEYNFMMGEAGGTAWIQGVLSAEKQMMESQSLVGEIETVSGATETVVQGFLPLATAINDRLANGTTQKFYRIAEDLGTGITAVLDVVVEDGKIIDCKYDEVFANEQDKIENVKFKKYYRTSKYESIMYKEDSKIGFKWQMDRLNDRVIETQDLFNLEGLLAVEKSDEANQNPSYEIYLKLAETLHKEMVKDNVLY